MRQRSIRATWCRSPKWSATLFRADDQPEQSYSERQIFEAATSRLARELAAMEEVDEPKAQEKILEILRASAAIYNKDKLPA